MLAHNKMICHSLKHLNSSVFGLLIGVTYQQSNTTYCHIMDVIPVQHTFFSSMVVEVAVLQIQEWLKQTAASTKTPAQNLRILGVYFANDHADDVSKNTSAVVVASKLVALYGRTSVLMCQVVADRIEAAFKGTDTAIDFYKVPGGNTGENPKDWKDCDDVNLVTTERDSYKESSYGKWLVSLDQLRPLNTKDLNFSELGLGHVLKQKLDEQIYDFEEHLDDQSKDWRNLSLFDMM